LYAIKIDIFVKLQNAVTGVGGTGGMRPARLFRAKFNRFNRVKVCEK
jgi:hypothetical protein